MKILKTILILLVLFALPAGSWYFLKDGLDWRKAKMEKLQMKEKFLDVYDFTVEEKNVIFEEMAYRTALIKLNSDLDKEDIKLVDQFRKTHTFMFFVMLNRNSRLETSYSSKYPIRYIKSSNMVPKNFEYNNAKYMLVDTSGHIRRVYQWTEEDKMKNIVEDLAVLLPKRPSPDISDEEPNVQR